MFEFIHVEKKFQEDFWSNSIKVLNDLSFKVEEGSLCGFLGANGAGKTTSIKALLRFIAVDKGKIVFSKSLGSDWQEVRRHIGYFPERPYFYPTMTGREFCLYLGRLSGVARKELKTNIEFWSKKININYALDKKIKNYSKGMLQRIGFVASVIHRPTLVVLDEPLSGLDPVGRKEFKDVLVELHAKGVTIFFSSHILSDIEEVCDHLVVIEKGQSIYCGPKQQLLDENNNMDLENIVYKGVHS